MILVYCPKITNRLKYALGSIFDSLLGQEWDLTLNADVFAGFQGAKINYSLRPVSDKEVFIRQSMFLEKRGLLPIEPSIKWKGKIPLLFANHEAGCHLGFDVFAAVFFLLSRYEEYAPENTDNHQRFKAENSFAFKNGFLEIPVVNHYALLLREKLLSAFPALIIKTGEYSFVPTYDIDIAYAYKGRGFLRTMGASLASLVKFNLKDLKKRYQVLGGQISDPFDTYDLQLNWHKKYRLKAFYFFLCGDYGPWDKNIQASSTTFIKLVKKISDYAYTGIHPSYVSNNDSLRLSSEVARLSKVLNREIRFSRQHFLKMKLPETYRNLIKNNIDHDFTMGYASQPGFRASIASPFYFYDLPREEITHLKILPFAVMDGTLKDYLGLTPQEANHRIAKLINETKMVNGTFMSLWHNDSLSEYGDWQGWRVVYESLLQQASSNS
jgi:hypothetical protein